MKYSPENDGKILMENYCKKIQSLKNVQKEIRPRICQHIVFVCEMAACIMVVNSLKNSNSFDIIADLIKKWSFIVITLMESDLRPDMSYSNIKQKIRTFVKVAPSASHLYLICDVIYSEVSKNIKIQYIIFLICKKLN